MPTRIKDYIRKKALGISGLIEDPVNPAVRAERLTFVNDIDEDIRNKLHEYNVWYTGDSEEILNYYSHAQVVEMNYDPIYTRNKKSYFWAISASEQDIKRTHSGQPRNIVDTLVNIVGVPRVRCGHDGDPRNQVTEKRINEILEENHFPRLLTQRARPFTFVEGWGAWKINWDRSLSDAPILLYYRADAVDFVYRSGKLAAIIYRDWYQDEKGHAYALFETRRRSGDDLIIEKELFRLNEGANLMTSARLSDLRQLKDVEPRLVITNYKGFLGWPSTYYDDPTGDCYGRSIFTGKIDMFDDLDQCMSQSANTVRRSTAVEYFDSMYLEKDDVTGMPRMPHAYDRKYIQFKSSRNADGAISGSGPVTVTQPALNFEQYSAEAQAILLQIISGIMSPATLGIDVAKKDNAEAQREKEKVTIFTRNVVMSEEGEAIRRICRDLMCADELMRTGEVTFSDYRFDVEYDEFADASFENKLETILSGWREGMVSDGTAMDYLYGNRWDKEKKAKEVEWIVDFREKRAKDPFEQGEHGEEGAENEHNQALESIEIGE